MCCMDAHLRGIAAAKDRIQASVKKINIYAFCTFEAIDINLAKGYNVFKKAYVVGSMKFAAGRML